MLSKTRKRLARMLDPATVAAPHATATSAAALVAAESSTVDGSVMPSEAAPHTDRDPWHPLAQQFAMRVLAASYQTSSYLAEAEIAEQDPDRLERLYRIDHTITRVRRHAENLQVLTGLRIEDAGRQITTVVDVIRAATSAIEQYARVRVGRVVELAVVEFAADDAIRILTELLDNATRLSPPSSEVIVSAHLTDWGQVLVRVEDSGVGVDPTRLPGLNAMLAGTEPPVVGDDPAAHLGLVVVASLALTHQMRVQLTARHPGGTTATVLIPGNLICEIPATVDSSRDTALIPRLRAVPAPQTTSASLVPLAQRTRTISTSMTAPVDSLGADGNPPADLPRRAAGGPAGRDAAGLPRRTPVSLRQRDSVPAPPWSAESGSADAEPLDSAPDASGLAGAAALVRDLGWPEDAGDFAAGLEDAMHFDTNTPAEGHPR